jgi:hypothetical protein
MTKGSLLFGRSKLSENQWFSVTYPLVLSISEKSFSVTESRIGRIARAREQKEKRLEWRGPQKSASGRLEDAEVCE